MTTPIEEHISFDFDRLRMFGVIESTVFIHGEITSYTDQNDNTEPCVLVMRRSLFMKALKTWLDQKRHHASAWKHLGAGVGLAGVGDVMVSIRAERPESQRFFYCLSDGEVDLMMREDSEADTPVLRTFEVDGLTVDMEHG
jgi:hypothetical protein